MTKRADEAVWAVESSPRVPRGELSGRFAARRKETQKGHHGHSPRFDKRTGKKKHPGNGFYKARHQIGRPDFRFHDLRHFAATMAAISGATTKELMQFAGHSDIHVAMRYQEAVTDRKRDLAHRMAALAGVPTEESHRDPGGSGRR